MTLPRVLSGRGRMWKTGSREGVRSCLVLFHFQPSLRNTWILEVRWIRFHSTWERIDLNSDSIEWGYRTCRSLLKRMFMLSLIVCWNHHSHHRLEKLQRVDCKMCSQLAIYITEEMLTLTLEVGTAVSINAHIYSPYAPRYTHCNWNFRRVRAKGIPTNNKI